MSTLSENSLIFDGGEDKQLKLYRDTYQECCSLSEKISKSELFKLWDEVIDLAKKIKKERQFLPTNKDLDYKIEEERRQMQAAEAKLNIAKQNYSSANFEYRKVKENVQKIFSLEFNDENVKNLMHAALQDHENLLKEQEERLLEKKQALLSLTL